MDYKKMSLEQILQEMPCVVLESSKDNHYRVFWKDKFSDWYDNPIDACVELLGREMTREKVVKSREYIFANEACKYADKDPINDFEDGAEYGYKFAVEKIENDMSNISKQVDNVNHPSHYTWLKEKCGIEVIDITRHLDFDRGNAIKYILRDGLKGDDSKAVEDIDKAIWYLQDYKRNFLMKK